MPRLGVPNAVASDSQVFTGSGRIRAVVLIPAAAVATLILYDNTAASGTVLWQGQAAANGSAVVMDGIDISFKTGVYADIGGAGAAALVYL